jgi:aminoglycoside/choline kinase family phosphotransferase
LKESEVIHAARECGFLVNKAKPLKLEASGRQYHRIYLDSGETKVLCYLHPDKGTHTKFLHISDFLLNHSLIDKSLDLLSQLQTANIPQIPKLDEETLDNQMNGLSTIFLKDFLSLTPHADIPKLQKETVENLLDQPWMNCHFDFERRNIILDTNKEVAIIDYQDLCTAPVGIDLAGLLIDHYVKYSDEMISNSLDNYSHYMNLGLSSEDIFEWVRWGAIQRNMRILGTLSSIYIEHNRSFRLKDLSMILDNLIDLIPDNNYESLKQFLSIKVRSQLSKKMTQI